jgi:hypothetical protein
MENHFRLGVDFHKQSFCSVPGRNEILQIRGPHSGAFALQVQERGHCFGIGKVETS